MRYGNVMCSRGSVIPLFVEQVAGRPADDGDRPEHDPVPDVAGRGGRCSSSTRSSSARPGDLFVRKAPASTVEVLATAVADAWASSREIEVIGTRHGEKLYETLATREELARSRTRATTTGCRSTPAT